MNAKEKSFNPYFYWMIIFISEFDDYIDNDELKFQSLFLLDDYFYIHMKNDLV